MDNNIVDSVLNNFLNSIINSKNNQTKEDILLGKIKFPSFTNKNESFKTKENQILKHNLLRRYKINLYAEERRKLERNVSNYEIQLKNLRQLNKDINIKFNNIEQNRLKSAYYIIPNNNQIKIDNIKNINQRALSNYKTINYENRNQYIKKRNQSNSPIKNNNSHNNNNFNKNIIFHKKIPQNIFIKPLVSSIKRDILRIKNEEKDEILSNNAKAFIKRLNGNNNKITSRVLKINREKNNDYIKKIEEDMKIYFEKKEKEKEEYKIMKLNDNKKNKIGYFEGKQIINKKYHYYTPRNNEENYSNNILNTQIKNNEDYIKNNSLNETPNRNKNKYINTENYSNKNNKNINENTLIENNIQDNNFQENNIHENYFQRINYDFDYESPSILEQNQRKSPYFFNEPKYNLSIEKRLEEFREKDKLIRKTYRSKFEDNNKSNNLSISNINHNNDLSNLNDNTELNVGNFNLNDNTELNEGNNFSIDNINENRNENNIENEKHNINENENNVINNDDNLNVNSNEEKKEILNNINE